MKKVGIWIDKEKAHLVSLQNEKEHITTINSEMEFFNPKGGSRSKTRWGPQDVVQDSKYLEREKHQYKSYFKQLAHKLKDADALVIFGPADTNDRFRRELEEHYTSIASKIKGVEKADSMSMNQVKAWVRNYYNS